MKSPRDTLYRDSSPDGPFEFNDAVADVFPDMLERSIPGYATTLSTIGAIASRYARPDTVCYDLGCSLGAATLAMRHAIRDTRVRIEAVDLAPAMVARCRRIIERDQSPVPVTVVAGDITTHSLAPASVVVMNFTLQFIDRSERLPLLRRIAESLLPGGVLLLSEKIRFDDSSDDELFADLHHAFKAAQGYSELEISRKRSALDNVLVRDTFTEHRQRLQAAGFSRVEQWFQCFNFASLIAVR